MYRENVTQRRIVLTGLFGSYALLSSGCDDSHAMAESDRNIRDKISHDFQSIEFYEENALLSGTTNKDVQSSDWKNSNTHSQDRLNQFVTTGPGSEIPLASCNEPAWDPSSHSLTVHKVMTKTDCNFWGCNWESSSPYVDQWEANAVDEDYAKTIHVGALTQPTPSAVRNVVFLTGGQQGAIGSWHQGDGKFIILTGQKDKWRDGWDKKTKTKTKTLHKDSVAARLLDENIFDPSDTLITLAFGNGYRFGDTAAHRAKILDGYEDWLAEQTDPSLVERVVLAGNSRGGCLAPSLLYGLSSRFPNAKFIVQSFDGVCNQNDSEIGTTTLTSDNPLHSNWKAYRLDLNGEFESVKKRLAYLNVVSGDPVTIGGLTGRGFVQRYTDGEETLHSGWLEQEWTTDEHRCMGVEVTFADRSIEHIQDSLARFDKLDSTSQIYNVATNQCLYTWDHLDNQKHVRNWGCWNSDSFEFEIEIVTLFPYFSIRAKDWFTQRCISAAGSGSLEAQSCNTSSNQVFRLDQSGSGYRFLNTGTGKCLTNTGGNGSSLQLQTCDGSSSQVFMFR